MRAVMRIKIRYFEAIVLKQENFQKEFHNLLIKIKQLLIEIELKIHKKKVF